MESVESIVKRIANTARDRTDGMVILDREWEALENDIAAALRAERAKLEKEPSAWRVYCPPQHECEFLVFWDRQDAEIKAEEFNDALPEGEARYFVEPLFAQAAEAAKEKQ